MSVGSVSVAGVSDIAAAGLTANSISLAASNGITINGAITTAGLLTLNADSDGNGGGTLTVASGVQLSTSGGDFLGHAAAISTLGNLSEGTGNATFNFSTANWHGTPLLSQVTTSGMVTVNQPGGGTVQFGESTSSITGPIVFNLPSTNVVLTEMNVGAADLRMNAASITAVGSINAGTATLDAPNVSLAAGGQVGTLTVPTTDNLWVYGGTLVAANVVNNGTINLGLGGQLNVSGTVSGAGNALVGVPVGSGTVAYYRFEGTAGTAATGAGSIVDSSGNGFNGTP